MTNNELELWNKIRAFQFDKPDVRLTFAKRLARENGISEQFANAIIDEYRKFVFLCCVSKQQVSPSHCVDLAWHLHLTYTKSYWIDLCRDTINRDLHHNPTEGGREEDQKFVNLYKRSLELYEQYFQSKAPENIWPVNNERQTNTLIEMERSRFWVIPKPAFSLGPRKNSPSFLALLIASLVFGCSAFAGSFPIILIILIILLILGVVILLAWRHNRQSNRDGGSGCGSAGCGSDGRSDHDSGDASDGGDSGCSSGCSGGGCGGGGD